MKNLLLITTFILSCFIITRAQTESSKPVREHLLMDKNWHFAYGHPYDVAKDYYHGTGYFSYITKTGYGDGPASASFNDSSWRVLNLPHDWAVEQGFSGNASHSHGYRTVGPGFPETSVGWYRKTLTIPASDLGRRISIQFDGVHRDAQVWINGFYMGVESSGYSDFQYDITPYLNYGGKNVLVVRVDVTMEEGWFYEGAGIYRHVWLNKTSPLHVAYNGSFISSDVQDKKAILTVKTKVENQNFDKADCKLAFSVIDAGGKTVASGTSDKMDISGLGEKELTNSIEVVNPVLWSLENPYLYQLKTTITQKDTVVDEYYVNFGIRTIRFDANEGFFLNGKHVELKGTCNHQDHAGVGTAIPDALQEFRIERLKSMGSNAYRCSHNPPTPELLNACDKLGMLVMCENRLLSTAPDALDRLKRMIELDRNHPSVIIWSLGNEEWAVEGNEKGMRISNELQAFAKKYDNTRPYTVASSGGWGHGDDIGLDMIGFNYIMHGNIDEHHKNFPEQLSVGTEESTTQGTRGIYSNDFKNGHMAPSDRSKRGSSIEFGWKFYDERPFLSGLFLWTGFDYRGEPNPLNYPAVSSQFGILDVCGFPKDPYYYLQAWWGNKTMLKITPHWTWTGQEGDTILVRVFSNCDEVELFLNGKPQGKKTMQKDSHLDWDVVYQPGTLLAKGYKNGKKIIEDKVETAGEAKSISLLADRNSIKADGEDVSVITVQVNDGKGRFDPVADNDISFNLTGPGKIIGVGNGDPASHEPDKYFREVKQLPIEKAKIAVIEQQGNQPEIQPNFDDSSWPYYVKTREQMIFPREKTVAVRCRFELPEFAEGTQFTVFAKSLAIDQSIYVNGHLIAENIKRDKPNQVFVLDNSILKPGMNEYVVVGKALYKRQQWEDLNTDPGLIQMISPKPAWKRQVFNGLAQIIVQSTNEAGEIKLTATSPGLKSDEITITTTECKQRACVP